MHSPRPILSVAPRSRLVTAVDMEDRRDRDPRSPSAYARLSPADWTATNLRHFAASETARNFSEQLRSETLQLVRETDELTRMGQREVGRRLGERVGDIAFWSHELDTELDKTIAEAGHLAESRRFLERALADTEQPLRVAHECLYHREKRQAADLVYDDVENQLLKEIEVIRASRDRMRQVLDRVLTQTSASRSAQHDLERDYGNKRDAFAIDEKCRHLSPSSQGLAFYRDIERVDKSVSVPGTWAEHTNRNIERSRAERSSSVRTRAEVESVVNAVANEMWLAWNNTNAALAQRIAETSDAQHKLQAHYDKVCQEIYELEKHIGLLRHSISSKNSPLQLAQTRLESRTRRPDVELCRDPPHGRLIREVDDLKESIGRLDTKLREAESALQQLLRTRCHLEQELKVKSNSLFIDREHCQGNRRSFPYTVVTVGTI